MKLFQIITIAPKPCHSHFCCWLLQIWPILNVYDGNGAYGLCRLGWWYNGAKLYFSWYYKILSIICNTAELSASHRRRATAMSIVACCRFVSTLIFGLKTKLMACVELVGGTTEQSCIFPDLIWYYQWYETLMNCLHYTSAVPQPFLLLISANLALAGCLGLNGPYGLCRFGWRYNRAKLYFDWPYMIVSIIWNNSEMSASYLSGVTAIFVVDCCQFGPNWVFGMKRILWTVPTWLAVQRSKALFFLILYDSINDMKYF